MKLAVVGAGIAGRCLALFALQRQWQVTVFDSGMPNVSVVAAGQLSPYCELDSASALVHEWGIASLPLWEALAQEGDFYFQRAGTLVVAAPGDQPELVRLERKVSRFASGVWRAQVAEREPELAGRFSAALHFPNEGQLETQSCLAWLRHRCENLGARWSTAANSFGAHFVDDERFDAVADCRGLAAKPEWRGLRGVRGEIARVHAPQVHLRAPVRLAHPRFALYVAPRPNQRYVIGATCLESEDRGAVRVRSALELLSAAYALHPGFGEATIETLSAQLRPALPDHIPRAEWREGVLRINGLYRHGFLVMPRLAQLAIEMLERKNARLD